MDHPTTEDETGRRIGLFCVGLSVAAFFAFLGWNALYLATVDTDSGSQDEVKWSALLNYPPLATPWAVAGLGVGIMAWAVFGRWSRAVETAGVERAFGPGRHFATLPRFPGGGSGG